MWAGGSSAAMRACAAAREGGEGDRSISEMVWSAMLEVRGGIRRGWRGRGGTGKRVVGFGYERHLPDFLIF